jgi:cysteine desulfurase / selenocysteine lyase
MKSIPTPDPLAGCRADFPALTRTRNGKPPIYLDNACTTLTPQAVIDSITEYYSSFPACGGRRSHHWFADEVTHRIEGSAEAGIKGSRELIAGFINAASPKEIIFTSNTTYAINLVALGFNFRPGDVVLVTDKEHNSNLLPWLRLQKSGLIKVDYVAANGDDYFDLQAFEQKLKNCRVRMVSMAYTSNVTGYSIPAKEIIKLAHQYGARVLLDAAQKVPHEAIDVQCLDVDFLAFSLHKMCGPRGVGILYAKSDLLNSREGETDNCDRLKPAILGGGTVNDTTYNFYDLLTAPDSFEAGIQNYAGLIAAGTAVCYLQRLGMGAIAAHEQQLNQFLTEELLSRYGGTGWFRILGPRNAAQRGGIVTFEVQRPNAIGIADGLSRKNNIMIRDGVFCVHSYFNARYGQGWMRPKSHKEHRMIYRVSFYLYNTIEECRVFVETLNDIFEERCYI